MNEIIKKTYELIDVLEQSDLISDLTKYKQKIIDNKELHKLVKEGNTTNDEYLLLDIKRRLYKYDEYNNYMNKYNELMYLVMDINHRFSKIVGKGSCNR